MNKTCLRIASICCINCPADIVLCVDISGSVRPDQFIQVLNFIETFINTFTTWGAPSGTRVALYSFGNTVQEEFSLSAHNTQAQAVADATNVRFSGDSSTRTDLVLSAAKSHLDSFGRQDVPKVVFVITYGKPSQEIETVNVVNQILGVYYHLTFLAVGDVNSRDTDIVYLRRLLSHTEFFISESDFNNLVPRVSPILTTLCDEIAPRPCTSTGMYTQTRSDGAASTVLRFDYRPVEQEVDIVVQTEVSGDEWIGFGINSSPEMTGADIVMAYVHPDGRTVIRDRKSRGRFNPDVDVMQNLLNANVKKVGNTVTMTYTRKLDTGDSQDLVLDHSNCPYVLFAVGPNYHMDTHTARIHSWRAASANRMCFCYQHHPSDSAVLVPPSGSQHIPRRVRYL